MIYKGKLYIVGLPIGNMEDITLRAINVLKRCDVILAEDTRQFYKIALAYDIKINKIISYHNYNEYEISKILEILTEKEVALVSDRGMPLISDPGFHLIKTCWEKCPNIIDIIPGVSAVTTAFSVSAFCNRFCFLGFLSSKDWNILASIPYSLVIFESPYRIHDTFKRLYDVLGPRKILICREMTKVFQEFLLTSLPIELEVKARGEFTLIISPFN